MSMPRICVLCGTLIPKDPRWRHDYYATRLYCNRACMQSHQPKINEDYIVRESGCWEWQGRIDRNGYGKAYDSTQPAGSRVDWAHRLSYRAHVGPIPERHQVDHTCQNTICVNPQHLDLVTPMEHARRTMERLGKDALQHKAATLRGLNLTYAEIAETLNLSGRQSAHSAVESAISKGLVHRDEVPPVHRLDDEDRADIAALHTLGVPQTEIAAWYRVDSSQISRICSGRTSGHSGGAA